MIEVKNISKLFSLPFSDSRKSEIPTVGIQNVSFTANDGEITGLLGGNGAGKSTTLRSIVGLSKPDSGDVYINDLRVHAHLDSVRRSLGYLPHDAGLYTRLTGIENIRYYAKLFGLNGRSLNVRIDELVALLGMGDFVHRRCQGYSKGQKTKVALARALVNRPQVLVLDEPTNGLDIVSVKSLRELLLELKAKGHCILISSHIMQEIELLCDRIVILNAGRVCIQGTQNDIQNDMNTETFEDAFVKSLARSETQKI